MTLHPHPLSACPTPLSQATGMEVDSARASILLSAIEYIGVLRARAGDGGAGGRGAPTTTPGPTTLAPSPATAAPAAGTMAVAAPAPVLLTPRASFPQLAMPVPMMGPMGPASQALVCGCGCGGGGGGSGTVGPHSATAQAPPRAPVHVTTPVPAWPSAAPRDRTMVRPSCMLSRRG
jgi:hypothetical protein